jgi:hypothetical protein
MNEQGQAWNPFDLLYMQANMNICFSFQLK